MGNEDQYKEQIPPLKSDPDVPHKCLLFPKYITTPQ